jgi:tetratricopeptide (TPR) repeat protein
VTTIFVSHATTDDALVTRIHDQLEAATGNDLWVDHRDLKPPESNWRNAIQKGLRDSDAGMIVLSCNSVSRPEIVSEWTYLLNIGRNLYVAKVDDVPIADVDYRLHILQWVDLSLDWDKGIAALAAYMNGTPVPDDAPILPARHITARPPIDRRLLSIPLSGRDTDLARVKTLLKQGPTMIVGVGGLGKSRLAAEVMVTWDEVSGAIWHVVRETSTADEVIELLREHFNIDSSASRAAVLTLLRANRRLIVIDNAESAVDDRRAAYAALVEELWANGARVLLTGREEWREIKPLGKHAPDRLVPEAAARVVLDMGLAFSVPHDLSANADEIARAARFHPRLMEWAVGQMTMFSPAEVIHELDALESEEVKDALGEMLLRTQRQMTEREGWETVVALRRLNVCRGGFTLEAAQAMVEGGENAVKTHLRVLQRWQFVKMRVNGDRTRYEIDPLVIEAVGEDETAYLPHFDYYQREHGDYGKSHNEDRFPLLTDELDNIRRALAWGFVYEPRRACDFVWALEYFLQFWLSLEQRRELLNAAYAAAVADDYVRGQSNTLFVLGIVSLREGELEAAQGYYERALAGYESIGSLPGQDNTLFALGNVSRQARELEAARGYYKRALAGYETNESRVGQANILLVSGDISLLEGELEAARGYYERALAEYEANGTRVGQANTLVSLGKLMQAEQNWTEALSYFERSIDLCRTIHYDYGRAIALLHMLPLLLAFDRVADALRAALTAMQIFTAMNPRVDVPIVRNAIRLVKAQIGTDAFDAAWQAVVGSDQPDWLDDDPPS